MASAQTFRMPVFRAVLLMAVASLPAWPGSITSTVAFADAPGGGGSAYVDSGELPGPTSAIAGPFTGNGGNGNLNAFARGSADFGILRAFASAYSPAFDVFQPQAYAIAKWRDTIHVISPGNVLPNGTPVTLFFSMSLGDTLTSIAGSGGGTVNARSSLDGIGAL